MEVSIVVSLAPRKIGVELVATESVSAGCWLVLSLAPQDRRVSLLFSPISGISEGSGILAEGFKIASHPPSVDLIHVIFRSTSRAG